MPDELYNQLLNNPGPYWLLKLGIVAVVLIIGVLYCRNALAMIADLERRRARYNERERLKLEN